MEKNYEKYSRDPAVHKKYGRAWKRIRDNYVKTHPFCERCFANGILVPVEEVHHKVPISQGGKSWRGRGGLNLYRARLRKTAPPHAHKNSSSNGGLNP